METIYSIDFAILNFIYNTIKCSVLDPVMAMLSYLGEAGAIWLMAAFITLFFKKTRPVAVMVIAALALSFFVGEIGLKHLIARPRPFIQNPDVVLTIKKPSGYSFPSGHSSSSFAASFVILTSFESKWVGLCSYALAALIVFSRLYNYVHFPTDVLAGMILGTICAAITVLVFRKTKLDKKLERDIRFRKKQG